MNPSLPDRSRLFAQRVTPDHHGRGVVLALLVLGCLLARTFLPALLALPYFAMQLAYARAGSLERDRLLSTPASGIDVVFVGAGVLSGVSALALLAYELVRRFLG